MLGDYYREDYIRIQDEKRHLSEMSIMQATGYYLVSYPNNSVDRLLYDMENREIPYSLGSRVKLLLNVIQVE